MGRNVGLRIWAHVLPSVKPTSNPTYAFSKMDKHEAPYQKSENQTIKLMVHLD